MARLLSLFRNAVSHSASDAELLARFVADRDEDAFAELVRRHGPVVYRVCRRLVGPDADDAFQAAFLVLATRPDAASAAGTVGGWLVGVAGRVARQMRRAAGRRARHEAVAAGIRAVEDHDEVADLSDQFRVLDEEIARLPDRLRDPIVLCLLQGRTQEQAAAELGRDARTLRRRLGRAKQVLRARLEGRGVMPLVAASLVTASGSVSAVPHALAARTYEVVFDFLTGGVAASPAPVALAKGVAMTMFARKLSRLLAVALVGMIGAGVVLAQDEKPAPALAPLPQPVKIAATKKAEEKRPFQIDAMCIEVPAGFLENAGLGTAEGGNAWALTQRETRMFKALISAQTDKKRISEPRLHVADNQTAYVAAGAQVPYTVTQPSKTNDGKDFPVTTIAYQNVGTSLRATPRLSADGKFILLRAETENSTVAATSVDLGNGVKSPAFNTQTMQTTVVLPEAGSMVIRSATTKTDDGKVRETFWLVSAHIVGGPAPAPAKPVVPVSAVPAPMFAPSVVMPPPAKP